MQASNNPFLPKEDCEERAQEINQPHSTLSTICSSTLPPPVPLKESFAERNKVIKEEQELRAKEALSKYFPSLRPVLLLPPSPELLLMELEEKLLIKKRKEEGKKKEQNGPTSTC